MPIARSAARRAYTNALPASPPPAATSGNGGPARRRELRTHCRTRARSLHQPAGEAGFRAGIGSRSYSTSRMRECEKRYRPTAPSAPSSSITTPKAASAAHRVRAPPAAGRRGQPAPGQTSRPTTAAADSTWTASADSGVSRRPITARTLPGIGRPLRPVRCAASVASRRTTSRTNKGLPSVCS